MSRGDTRSISRRRFMQGTAAGALSLALAACRARGDDTKIERRAFGRTGHKSTRVLFGAYALAYAPPEAADEALLLLQEYGVNHIDTAPSYGSSELRLAAWMPDYREAFFLATKTDQRAYAAAQRQIEGSLRRLQVDQVDLLQLHNLVDEGEWERVMGEDGALKAVIEARDQGLTRFIGVTGHGLEAPAMHRRSLERFDFDSVLLPLNYPLARNAQYMADFQALMAVCRERDVAVQIIKSVARGPWGARAKRYDTWYEPLDEAPSVDKAVHWALAQGDVFLNTAGELEILPMMLEAARGFRAAPDDAAMAEMATQLEMEPLWG